MLWFPAVICGLSVLSFNSESRFETMGNSAIKTFKVKNQYKDPVYFKIGLKELKTNVFENQGEDFYRRSRGFQRIGPGDIVAEELDVSRKEVVYFTVGTDSGMQITDCLSKQAFGRTLVISEAGSLTDRRLTTFWNYEESEVRDIDGKSLMTLTDA